MPLHLLARHDMAEWLASADFAGAAIEPTPESRPLPSVAAALKALRDAGCHGTNWFEVAGEGAGSRLPECPGYHLCQGEGDLGEVSIFVAGWTDNRQPISARASVETVAFRKPTTEAVLAAACAMASSAGPQVVFDDSGGQAFVIRSSDDVGSWPW
jgi:hypothetical protein